MASYQSYYDSFNIDNVKALFEGDFNQGVNAAIECCDRYADTNKIAIYYEGVNGEQEAISFKKLKEESSKVANFLVEQGLQPGECISTLMPRTPELVYTIVGAWRAGLVYQPMFTAFGPMAIDQRLEKSNSKIVFTDEKYREKFEEVTAQPKLCVLVRSDDYQLADTDWDFRKEMAKYSTDFEPVLRQAEDLFILLSTSGTTGKPKAVPIPNKALLSFNQYMKLAVDLREEDNFWNLADPGWAYGIYYTIVGPLQLGKATLLSEGGFSAEDTYRLIKKYKITNLAGSPTAFRMLIGAGEAAAHEIKGQLRVVNSAGEALNAEVIRWFDEHLDTKILDHYGQTELGMVINNHHALEHPVKPGSMGYAMPGYTVVILNEAGQEVAPDTPGELAVVIDQSPLLWFSGYQGVPTPAIANGYYRTGDSCEQAADGRVTYVGRHDDVITTSGYRVGPFDVESTLMEHPAPLEVAVIGKPDPERTELIKAYVVLKKEFSPSEELAKELEQFVKKRLAAHAYPREVEFIDELPKTPSGKIQRFILRSKNL